MKTLISILLFASSTSAFAGTVHKFDCLTTQVIEGKTFRKPTRFQFNVANLETGRISYVDQEGEDGQSAPVKHTPLSSVLMLNDNYGIKRVRGSKDLELDSDGDGFQFTTVHLYANSGYENGWAQVRFSSPETPIYSPVVCQVKKTK